MIFNPWWETPDKLARLDKLPAFQKNPEMVSRLGFEVLDRQGNPVDPAGIDWHKYSNNNFPFRLRQRPGPENALGQVKIMFPNKHDVYLHDTPSRNLFMKTERAFSSGCVRVANVLELASWLLSGSADWNREKIDRILASTKETRVNLPVKVPVYILYFTAVTGIDGNLRLINDIYQRDEALIKALQVPELVM
jgi:murein L,D-transpeptidase YcbB/YkuD